MSAIPKLLLSVRIVSQFCAAFAFLAMFEFQARAETKGNPTLVAKGLVQQALQAEAAGKFDDRNRLLSEADAKAPDLAAVQWARGLIHDNQRGWVTAKNFANPDLLERLNKYESQRDNATDAVASQLALANWCHKEGLLPQEKAHLSRIIDQQPDHEEARSRLGFIRTLNGWENQSDLAAARQREETRQKNLAKWLSKVTTVRMMMNREISHNQQRIDEKLMELRNSEAIPAMETLFLSDRLELARPVLTTLANIPDPDASVSLARFAIVGQDPAVRDDASRKLIRRDVNDYIPPMLAAMHIPARGEWQMVATPDGRLIERQTFTREGQDQRDILVLDTNFVRLAVGGDSSTATARALQTARDDISDKQSQLRSQNQFDTQLNKRITDALNIATAQKLPDDPAVWWAWWNKRNEVQTEGSKLVNGVYQSQLVAIVDQPFLPRDNANASGQTTRVQERKECLAAGTPVWTIRGPRAIETIRPGDQVLSQHPDTGELAYKSVLKATTRPAIELKTIHVNGETWNTTGGHQFWVSGRAWVKASNLNLGDVLHGTPNPITITAVEPGPKLETYNLVVDDFHTYFIGTAKVLTHDFTAGKATRSVVPGLLKQ